MNKTKDCSNCKHDLDYFDCSQCKNFDEWELAEDDIYDLPNIKCNQLLETIDEDCNVRIVSYESEEVLAQGRNYNMVKNYINCDFDVLSIEAITENFIEITIQTEIN